MISAVTDDEMKRAIEIAKRSSGKLARLVHGTSWSFQDEFGMCGGQRPEDFVHATIIEAMIDAGYLEVVYHTHLGAPFRAELTMRSP